MRVIPRRVHETFSQVHELPEEFLVGCFIRELRDAIKYEIIVKNPPTIEEAMRLARVEEEKLSNQRKSEVHSRGKSPAEG